MAITEKSIEFLGNSLAKGRPIPGQSLTNSPDQQYPWEQAPELTNAREAMFVIFDSLTEDEALTNILFSLNKGVGVIDLASITLYTGFVEGKWNPDLMLLLMEPTMYMIMALAEKAEIDYVMDSGDLSKQTDMSSKDKVQQLQTAVTSLDEVRRKAVSDVSPQSVPEEVKEKIEETVIPTSLLEQVQSEQPTSLLGKRD
jgi:hypothetical protein